MSSIVTVTGASGHIGAYVVRALVEQGRRVRAVDIRNGNPLLKGLDVEHVRADITDPVAVSKAVEGSDVVYHLAAIIALQEWNQPLMWKVNTDGVTNVVNACLEHGVRRLVHFTSIHAFRPVAAGEVVTEQTELSLNARVPAYDRSKAEGVLRVREGMKRGLDAVMLHPVGVIGPGDHGPSHIGGAIVRMARGRMPVVVEGGFTWVDVRDVASTALAAEERGRKGEHYILGGEWLSAQELGAIVGRTLGVKPPSFAAPLWLASALVPLSSGFSWITRRPTPFNTAAIHALKNHRLISHAKAERELGHRPRPIEETVADTVYWFRENGYLA